MLRAQSELCPHNAPDPPTHPPPDPPYYPQSVGKPQCSDRSQPSLHPEYPASLKVRVCPVEAAPTPGGSLTANTVNDELAAKIESELSMEKEMRDPEAIPAHLKEYIDNSPFDIEDVPGKEEVVMTRTYGDEKIRITFSIDDLNNVDEDPDQMPDENSMVDELDDPSDIPTDTQSGGANTKGSINQGRTRGGNVRVAPEDSIAPADRPELTDEEGAQDEEGEQEPSFPSHCYITVERPNKGALQIEAVAQDGMMVIENVYYYKDAKFVEPKSRADEEGARDLYTGPPFGNLDEDLQLLFEKYLEERGINTTMALFVPEYIDFKEQREYLSWLNGESKYNNFMKTPTDKRQRCEELCRVASFLLLRCYRSALSLIKGSETGHTLQISSSVHNTSSR